MLTELLYPLQYGDTPLVLAASGCHTFHTLWGGAGVRGGGTWAITAMVVMVIMGLHNSN